MVIDAGMGKELCVSFLILDRMNRLRAPGIVLV